MGHTIGGVQRFDSRFYEKQFCTPRITNHDGGNERVYTLEMPEGDWTAYVTLDSPCADLDVAADEGSQLQRQVVPYRRQRRQRRELGATHDHLEDVFGSAEIG